MALSATINIPTYGEPLAVEMKAAGTVVFIGANGSGKTRLGAFLDASLSKTGTEVHRIAAHRSLNLNRRSSRPTFKSRRTGSTTETTRI